MFSTIDVRPLVASSLCRQSVALCLGFIGLIGLIGCCGGCQRKGGATKAPRQTRSTPSSHEKTIKTVPSLEEIKADLLQASNIARGMLLYDLTAWHGTDALLASDYSGAPFKGFLVTAESATNADLWMLGALPDDKLGVVAHVHCDVEASPEPCTVPPDFAPRPMTADEQTMHRAIETAVSDPFFAPAQEAYNYIVLKGSDYGVDAGWLVYIVASTTDANVIPVGRHFRFDISPTGAKVLRRRASHRTIIESRRDELPEGVRGEVVAVMSSAVFDAYPTEFQFYVSGLWRVDLSIVGCDGSLWNVDGLSVEQLQGSAPGAKCPNPWKEANSRKAQ